MHGATYSRSKEMELFVSTNKFFQNLFAMLHFDTNMFTFDSCKLVILGTFQSSL